MRNFIRLILSIWGEVTVRHLIIGIALYLASVSASAQETPRPIDYIPTLPDGCHAIYQPAAGIADRGMLDDFVKNQIPSFETLHKYDVFCMGETIEINRNLYTNGGNVYILADKLIFNASIDTGVYRPFSDRMMFAHATKRNGDPRFTSKFGNPYRDTLGLIGQTNSKIPDTPNYLGSFRGYYEIDSAARQVREFKLLRRMPDGMTPPTPYPLRDNPTPPAIAPPANGLAMASFVSGDVHLYIDEVEFNTALDLAIDTSGLMGGIGGAAAPDRCVGFPNGTFSCLIVDALRPGLNTAGGSGGRAGSIAIYTSDASPLNRDELFNLQGGEAGRSTIFRSPKLPENQNTSLKRGIEDFTNEGEHPAGAKGVSGNLTIMEVAQAELIRYFVDAVEEREGFRDYATLEFAKRAQTDASLSVYRPSQFVQAKLDEFYRSRMWYLIPAYGHLLRDGMPGDISSVARPSVFCGEARGSASNLQTDSYLSLIHSVCGLSNGTTGLDSYLLRRGGYFALTGAVDPTAYLGEERLITTIVWSAQDWANTVAQLTELNSTTYEVYHLMRRQGIERRLGEIDEQISSLQAAIQRAKQDRSLISRAGQLASLGAALGDIRGGARSFSDAFALLLEDGETIKEVIDDRPTRESYERYTEEDREDQMEEIGVAGEELFDGLVSLDAALASLSYSGDDQGANSKIQALKAEAIELRQLLARLAKELARKKTELSSLRDRQLLRGLQARLAFGSINRSTARYLNELLTVSIISYVKDPNRDTARLTRNLNQLAEFLAKYPFHDGAFELASLTRQCQEIREIEQGTEYTRGNEDCVRVHATTEDLVLYGWLRTAEGTLLKLPLYRFERWGGNHAVPIYAINDYVLE